MDTFRDVIVRTMERAEKPLTPSEIWAFSEKWGTRGDFVTTGKTPDASVGAHLYSDIKANGVASVYEQVGTRPARFWLKSNGPAPVVDEGLFRQTNAPEGPAVEDMPEPADKPGRIKERDLHPFVAAFVNSNSHFNARAKTIFHERSKQRRAGEQKWLHPDMVGVRYPFDDFDSVTTETQARTNNSSIKFYAFELKLKLTLGRLREYYFQAVSNASWANEGYLVCAEIQDEAEVVDECRRLTNAFGIGLVKLDLAHIHESQILLPARNSPTIDWEMVDKIARANPDFRDFLQAVNTDMTIGRVTNPSVFDAFPQDSL